MYKFVFIDLDDTLWDFHANAQSALQDVFAELQLHNYFLDFNQFFQLYIAHNYELWTLYGRGEISKTELQKDRFEYPFTQVGVTDTLLAKNTGNKYLEILPTKKGLVEGAIEILDYLYSRYPLTIVSNGFEELQHLKMKGAGIEHYFRHIVLSETAKALKPDKKIFDFALKLNNALASETIMIGDSFDADIVGAKNACIDQVFFNPTPRIDNLLSPIKPNWEIKNLREITAIL